MENRWVVLYRFELPQQRVSMLNKQTSISRVGCNSNVMPEEEYFRDSTHAFKLSQARHISVSVVASPNVFLEM